MLIPSPPPTLLARFPPVGNPPSLVPPSVDGLPESFAPGHPPPVASLYLPTRYKLSWSSEGCVLERRPIINYYFRPTVVSLQCYECRTDYSWEKCDYLRTKTTCPASKPACITLQVRQYKTREDTFIKGCWARGCNPKTDPVLGCGSPNACAVNCCENDLCNSAVPGFRFYPTKYRTLPPSRSAASRQLANCLVFMAYITVVALALN